MRPLFAGLMLAVLAAAAGQSARAGMLAACEEPAGFAGPVQVFVLQYGFEPGRRRRPELVETARRLSYLIQLDVLANDSYGSIASICCRRSGPTVAVRAWFRIACSTRAPCKRVKRSRSLGSDLSRA